MGKKIWPIVILSIALLAILGYFKRDFFIANKGIFYFQKGKYERAIEVLESVVPRRPRHFPTAFHLSLAYWKLGRYERAEQSLARFLNANPGNFHARKELAFLIFHRGRVNEAGSLFSGLLSPDNKDIRRFSQKEKVLGSAIVDYAKGDWYQALNALENLQDLPPGHEALLFALRGLCFDRIGIYQRARFNLEAGLELFRDNPLLLIRLSGLYFSRDNQHNGFYYYDLSRSIDLGIEPKILEGTLDSRLQVDDLAMISPGIFSLSSDVMKGTDGYRENSLEDIPIKEKFMNRLPDDVAPVIVLFRNGPLQFDLTARRDGQYKIIIEARGTSSNFIWPRAALSINGIFLEHLYIRGENWTLYPVELQLLEGDNSIEVFYINDEERLTRNEDRNLFLRRIYITKEAR